MHVCAYLYMYSNACCVVSWRSMYSLKSFHQQPAKASSLSLDLGKHLVDVLANGAPSRPPGGAHTLDPSAATSGLGSKSPLGDFDAFASSPGGSLSVTPTFQGAENTVTTTTSPSGVQPASLLYGLQ
jgi:hypothetical protein